MNKKDGADGKMPTLIFLGMLFFISGMAALVYQVSWQRVLFSGLGGDAMSVAIIVSVFMAGLGFGGLLGGWMADRFKNLVLIFVWVELGIGFYGLQSVWLLDWLMSGVLGFGKAAVPLGAVLALLLPTLLMGATLPVLVVHVDRVICSIGESTGRLYFVNTMGAATGALATSLLLFHVLDLREATWLAAGLNFIVAFGGYLICRGANR